MRADLAEHLLPDVRMLIHLVRDYRIERQAAPLEAVVVARKAIFIDESAMCRDRHRWGVRQLLCLQGELQTPGCQ